MTRKQLRCVIKSQCGKIDIFGYRPNKRYQLTLHHIKPLRRNGQTTIKNCCLLREDIHILLNRYEQIDPENGKYINDYIKKVKVLRMRD